MYDNIASLRFDVDSSGETAAGAMVSVEGEVMELKKPIPVECRVEDWMMGVLLEMRRTNRLITKEAVFHYCENKSRCVCVTWGLFRIMKRKNGNDGVVRFISGLFQTPSTNNI